MILPLLSNCSKSVAKVKQLNGTARVLAPGVYVFSKRAEHLIVQKDTVPKPVEQSRL